MKLVRHYSIFSIALFLFIGTISASDSFGLGFHPTIIDAVKNQVAFAFDYHDVLVTKQWSQICKKTGALFFQIDNKLTALRHIYAIYKTAKQISKNATSTEDLINQLIEQYQFLHPYRTQMLDIANTVHTPIASSVQCAQRLKNDGYLLAFASNIGKESFKSVQKQYSTILNMFDCYCISRRENEKLIAKPHVDYYRELAHQIKEKNPAIRIIIFIDDSKKNVDGALAANKYLTDIKFAPIHFTKKTVLKREITDTLFSLIEQREIGAQFLPQNIMV